MSPLPSLRFPILLFGLILAALLPMLVISVVAIEWIATQERTTAEYRLLGTARGIAASVGGEVSTHVRTLEVLASTPALDWPLDVRAADAQIRRTTAVSGTHIVLLDKDGRVLAHSAVPFGDKLPEAEHVAEAELVVATRKPLILNRYLGPTTHRPTSAAMVPVIRNAEVVAVLVTGISIERLNVALQPRIQGRALSVILLDSNDMAVAAFNQSSNEAVSGSIPATMLRDDEGKPRELFRYETNYGDKRIYAQTTVPSATNWTVLVSRSLSQIDAAWHWSLLTLCAGGLVALALGFAVALQIARLVLVPVNQLERYATRIATSEDSSGFDGRAEMVPAAKVAEFEALRRGFIAAEAALQSHTRSERNARIALQESEAQSSALLATLDSGIFIARDLDGTIRHWSAGCEQLYGWTAAEAVGRSAYELLHVRWPTPFDQITSILRREGTWTGELQHRTRQGRELTVTAYESIQCSADGREIVLEVLTDVTAYRQAEATLEVVLDALPVGVSLADNTGRIIRRNAAHIALWGPQPNALSWEGYDAWIGYSVDTGERIQAEQWPMARAVRLGEIVSGELIECQRFGTGERCIFISSAAPIRDRSGSIVGGVVANLDITDARLIEDKLAQSQAQLRTLIETVPVGLVMAEFPSGRLIGSNRYVETLLRSPLPTSIGFDRYHEFVSYHADGTRVSVDELPLVRMYRRGEENPSIEMLQERSDGSRFWLRVDGRPVRDEQGRLIGGVLALLDIDDEHRARDALTEEAAELERLVEARTGELRDTEVRLAQAAKMEALGRLAGGVAHDFNNILQVVQGSAEMAIKLLRREPDQATAMLGLINDAASRGMGVTRRLLAFARRSDLSAGAVLPSALLEGLTPMLQSTLGPMVTLRVEAPSEVPALLADQEQLETVIVNLVNNARDALPSSGGRITLAAAPERHAPPPLGAGRYVRLSIADTGMGMSPEILARVTEPFFTTKGPGRGTGLGLAMARGFAEQSGGLMTIDSRLGHGTTVSLWFPVALEIVAETVSDPEDIADRTAWSGTRVLMVDDDPSVRAVLSSILDNEGYTVTEAENSDAALGLLDTGLEIDALVTDLSMPGALDGLGLVHAARQRRSEMPAVLITGHLEDRDFQSLMETVGSGPFAVLRKPVPGRVLCAAVEEVLSEASELSS